MRKFIQLLYWGVALESMVFYSQNKISHQFNDFICCQRINCSFWMQNKFTGPQFFKQKQENIIRGTNERTAYNLALYNFGDMGG